MQSQGHNEQKFQSIKSWGHGNRLGPRYLYGSKMAHFPFIKTGYFVLFFHFDFWGTSNQQNWLIFSQDGDFSTAISNQVRLFFYLTPNRNYSTAKSRKPSKTPLNPGFSHFMPIGGLHTPKNVPYYQNTVSMHVLGHTRVHSTHFPWLGTVKHAPKCDPMAPKKSRFTTVSPETSPYQSEMSLATAIPSISPI